MRADASLELGVPVVGEHRLINARGWEVPTIKDPRLPFAALLAIYAILGFTPGNHS